MRSWRWSTYDDAGNVLSIADTPAGGQRDIQCFTYDHLRRLTEAWATDNTNPDPCLGGPAVTGTGGPAPYHQSWTFDTVGNRLTETIHSTSGGTDTERRYTYPAPGAPQPHTLTRIDETGSTGAKTYTYGYDPAGNTISRNLAGQNQTLTWDPEGHLATVTEAGQTTSFIYDADGNRLLRKEPGATTLYLPGFELRLDHTTRQVTGTRFYTFAGKTIAVRDTTGVHFMAADHHGTNTAAINATTGAITWRRSTPYGGPRGPQPASWPDQKGFVGGTHDPISGLTHLGAREYDPLTGRFLSVDPLMDLYEPQHWNGYAYGNNSPVTISDRTGLTWSWFEFATGLYWGIKNYPRDTAEGIAKFIKDPKGTTKAAVTKFTWTSIKWGSLKSNNRAFGVTCALTGDLCDAVERGDSYAAGYAAGGALFDLLTIAGGVGTGLVGGIFSLSRSFFADRNEFTAADD